MNMINLQNDIQVLDQIKPELSLEANMNKMKLLSLDIPPEDKMHWNGQ